MLHPTRNSRPSSPRSASCPCRRSPCGTRCHRTSVVWWRPGENDCVCLSRIGTETPVIKPARPDAAHTAGYRHSEYYARRSERKDPYRAVRGEERPQEPLLCQQSGRRQGELFGRRHHGCLALGDPSRERRLRLRDDESVALALVLRIVRQVGRYGRTVQQAEERPESRHPSGHPRRRS